MAGDHRTWTHAFCRAEIELWREGPEHYLLMIARMAEGALDRSGAFGPYEFSCGTQDFQGSAGYLFVANEIRP